MKIFYNEDLKNYTSVKIGGIGRNVYLPESVEELVDLLNKLKNTNYYLISGGSNILMNDKKTFEHVIVLTKMDESIVDLENGRFYVGASVKSKKLISTINKKGYCGIEYLYSLPSLVGGNIVMNAGRGRIHNLSISDYIESVNIYDNGHIKVLSKSECDFQYRESIFKNSNLIVLGATFQFEKIDLNNPNHMTRQERMEFSKAVQDYTGPSFGSVFSQHDKIILQMFRLLNFGSKNGMMFSKKTSNWLTNKGEGTFIEAVTLIKRVQKIHRLVGKKAVPEVRIWD